MVSNVFGRRVVVIRDKNWDILVKGKKLKNHNEKCYYASTFQSNIIPWACFKSAEIIEKCWKY